MDKLLNKRFTFLPAIDPPINQSINHGWLIGWSEGAIPFKSAKQSSCLSLPFPESNSHLAKNSLPREAVQATHGTGFWYFTIFECVEMHFPQEVFLYRIYMKLVCCKAKILNVKSPVPTFLSFPKPFSLRPTKMFISAKTWILFWRLNSVWEKFLSPMDLTECARFRNLPSFQSGAMRRPYCCALYLEIYVVESVQSACLGVGQANKLGRCLCLDKSKSLIYTGGHDSYVLVRMFDWKLIRSRNQTYTIWVTIVGQARGAVFEIARFSNKEKNQRLQLWTGEVEKNNKQIPIEEKIRKFLSFGFILSAL